MTQTDALLRDVEPLTHADRMRRLVAVGQNAASGDAGAAAIVEELGRGDVYERLLALQSCFGSRDAAVVLQTLESDPSHYLRALAAKLVPLVCDDEQVDRALENVATFAARRRLLAGLNRRKRLAPVDRFLQTLAERSDPDLPRLLRFGSPAGANALLDEGEAGEQAAPSDWAGWAAHHPEQTARALLARARAAAGHPDARLVAQANAALPTLADRAPEAALDLVRALFDGQVPLARLELQRLAERRPNEVADLLLGAAGERPRVRFAPIAHRLGPERLLALAAWENGALLGARSEWFRRLRPDDRLAVYDVCGRGWQNADGCLDAATIALLPRFARETEGRRHLGLPVLAARPAERLPYAAFLPWNEARALLDLYLNNPDPALRVLAHSTIAGATRYDRARLPDLIALVRARNNEQDPVRGTMLAGLAALPPGRWQTEHLDDLGQVLRAALDAADLSPASAGHAERLVVRLLPFHPDWAAGWLAILVKERGQVSFYGLGAHVTEAEVRERIGPAVLPVLRSWETRERISYLFAAAGALGRRLRVFDGLLDVLERLAQGGAPGGAYTSVRALALLAEHGRERFRALVPALLKADKSWITQPLVYSHLHRRRQDLLGPFLGQRAYAGRFSTGKTRFVLPLESGFWRWTPDQQRAFAQTLERVTRDDARDNPSLLQIARQLAALPAAAPTRLVEMAGRPFPQPAVREAALRALGGRDNGDGVPALLDALGDARARVAIYALRRALLEMPAARALDLLNSVPLGRVTAAKEVVRLLGDLRGTDVGRQRLLALAARTDLDRDVRVAIVRALWEHVEHADVWPLLESAAAWPDPALATVAGRIPAGRLSPEAGRRLARLIATLLAHPDPVVRLNALGRCADLPVPDPERALLGRLLAALDSPLPDEVEAAARAVFATYAAAGRDAAGAVGQAAQSVLPHRRALQTVVRVLEHALAFQGRRALLPAARAVLDALASDPLTARLRAELAVLALPGDELAGFFVRLAETNALHAGALAAAAGRLEQTKSAAPDDLARLENALSSHPDERLRRLALAALVARAESGPAGWDADCRARLDVFRADPSPLVAEAAQFTFAPPETPAAPAGEPAGA